MTILTSFPLVYFIFISLFQVRNGRTFLPVTPFVFLLALGFLMELVGRMGEVPAGWRRVSAGAALVLTLMAGIAVPLVRALAFNRRLTAVDARETSRVWIEENIPAGSHIALESWSPYLSRDRYQLEFVQRAAEQPADWYAGKGVQYVVFSGGMYGRYLRDPERYPERLAEYRALWARFPEVRRFRDGGYEVRVHAVR